MTDTVDLISNLQAEIVNRVEAIQKQREEKKTIMASYNECIKALETERDALIVQMNEAKEEAKRAVLVEQADEILEDNAMPGDDSLALVI